MQEKEKGFYSFDGHKVAPQRVFLVRLGQGGNVDHRECVELWSGLIYDSRSHIHLLLLLRRFGFAQAVFEVNDP